MSGALSVFSDVKNILALKLRHIGDVLLMVPALRAVKETFPQARLTALVNSGTEEMLTLNPLVDEVVTFNRNIKGSKRLSRASGELAFVRRLRNMRFDMTVDFTGGDRAAITALLTGARYRLGYRQKKGFWGKNLLYTHTAPPPEARMHTVLRDYNLVKSFGMETEDLTVDFYTSEEDETYTESLLREGGYLEKPFVHVHPVSRWLFKCWKAEHTARILDRLLSEGLGVVVTSGPEEREKDFVRTIISFMKNPPLDISGRTGLKHLACISRRALFFLGVDSAPMHIAAATDTPVVALFGPSGAFDWGPWDNTRAKGSVWLKGPARGDYALSPYPLKNGVQTSGPHRVLQLGLDCVPCGNDGCNGTKKSDCLDALEPQRVWEALKVFLGERRSAGNQAAPGCEKR